MKLINKISIWFLCIILVITPVTIFISHSSIKRKITDFEIKRLRSVNDHVISLLRSGQPADAFLKDREVVVAPYAGAIPPENPQITKRVEKVEGMDQKELALFVTSYHAVNGKNYKITTHSYFINPNEFFSSMFIAMLWKMLLISATVFISARIFSKTLFRPFKSTLEAIRHFNVRQKKNWSWNVRLQLSSMN